MSQGNMSLSSVIDLVSQEKGIDRSVLVEATEQESLTTSGPKTMPVVIGDVALIGDAWSRS